MIIRRDAIKRAVVASNAVTEVTIGGNRYTVADAVELRRHGLSYRRTLLQAMTLQLKRVRSTIEQKNGEELTRAADKMVEVYYGRQTGREGHHGGDEGHPGEVHRGQHLRTSGPHPCGEPHPGAGQGNHRL